MLPNYIYNKKELAVWMERRKSYNAVSEIHAEKRYQKYGWQNIKRKEENCQSNDSNS